MWKTNGDGDGVRDGDGDGHGDAERDGAGTKTETETDTDRDGNGNKHRTEMETETDPQTWLLTMAFGAMAFCTTFGIKLAQKWLGKDLASKLGCERVWLVLLCQTVTNQYVGVRRWTD